MNEHFKTINFFTVNSNLLERKFTFNTYEKQTLNYKGK